MHRHFPNEPPRSGMRCSVRFERALLLALALGASACGAAGARCPTASPAQAERWQSTLKSAPPLELLPSGHLSIKSDLHELVVDTDAMALATAFHAVMRDPNRRFGLIRLDRLPENVGKPFAQGERFQGRYELAAAARQLLPGKWKEVFGPMLDDKGISDLLCNIENGHTSDYGEVVRLELDTPRFGKYSMQYRYLQGSPIAGSSTFEVMDVTNAEELAALGVPKAARVRQIFVYQEQSDTFANFFSSGGLKLHDQVLHNQVTQAAAAAGARVIQSDIPAEYAAQL